MNEGRTRDWQGISSPTHNSGPSLWSISQDVRRCSPALLRVELRGLHTRTPLSPSISLSPPYTDTDTHTLHYVTYVGLIKQEGELFRALLAYVTTTVAISPCGSIHPERLHGYRHHSNTSLPAFPSLSHRLLSPLLSTLRLCGTGPTRLPVPWPTAQTPSISTSTFAITAHRECTLINMALWSCGGLIWFLCRIIRQTRSEEYAKTFSSESISNVCIVFH